MSGKRATTRSTDPEPVLADIAAQVVRCTLCPLHRSRTRAVPGEGPADAKVMIIGEAPGRSEDMQGRPFVGAAGRKLDSLLVKAGLDRSQTFITNVVKCRPPNNRRPSKSEADTCSPYLRGQMEQLRAPVIVLLGDSALKRFFPDKALGKVHGKLLTRDTQNFFATYHPAAMLYNASLEGVTREDFEALGRVLPTLTQHRSFP